jgi:hypothetical protein
MKMQGNMNGYRLTGVIETKGVQHLNALLLTLKAKPLRPVPDAGKA